MRPAPKGDLIECRPADMTKSRRPDIGKRPDKILRETAPLPPEPWGHEGTTTGTVKFFKADKGWGAIETAATAPCHGRRWRCGTRS